MQWLGIFIVMQRSCFKRIIVLYRSNKVLDGLVKPKWFACVLSDRVMLKDNIGRICFYPMTHVIFPSGSVTLVSSNVSQKKRPSKPTLPKVLTYMVARFRTWPSAQGRNEGAWVAQFPGRRITIGAPNDCGERRIDESVKVFILKKCWNIFLIRN